MTDLFSDFASTLLGIGMLGVIFPPMIGRGLRNMKLFGWGLLISAIFSVIGIVGAILSFGINEDGYYVAGIFVICGTIALVAGKIIINRERNKDNK